uniref:putative nuclease HARBI1 n=1 Tax=Pristiophorus japonicus TaxID=55135 RepID=UPI00398F5E97
MSEEQCIRKLWFRQEVVTELCHLLHTDLEAQSGTRTSLSVSVKVTVMLNFYATGPFQAPVGDICNISQFAVHCCIRQVTDALCSRRMNYINFSMSREKQDGHSHGFARIVGFPIVQGAIDCMHVELQAPPHNGEVLCNCKGDHSLNIQLVCDHRQMVLAVNARYPVSSHDSFILRENSVPQLFQPLHAGHDWFIDDKGYGLVTWLMTTPAKQCYNHNRATTRAIIDQTIGNLKQRFCYLDCSGGKFQYTPDRLSMSTIVCCRLHNLAIMRGQSLSPGIAAAPQEDDDDEEEDEGASAPEEAA